ncbi:B3 domain-containing protein REM10-like isoform X2 [Impatiens glandulifera]|uniref:B3 domain-containing protein REM10-like isoform X2 n=1 Tax=Impatiens glandulifera TaxID=253017 RepID=UPI001FB0614D|nr:B3 domain-containing protein REM10-like isoform X2 [Impatiens glandulifera]
MAAESKSKSKSNIVTIGSWSMKNKSQWLPRKLVSENGLERNCNMKLDDEKGRSYVVEARFYNSSLYISKGWNDFLTKNHLKLKDCLKFELIKNGQIPHLRVTKVQKKNDHKELMIKSKSKSKSNIVSPAYMVTIGSWSLKRKSQWLPRKLVSENGLEKNCNMKLVDEKERSYLVEARFYPKKSSLYISKGWNDFLTKNHLKLKDCLKFQLIENGQIPHLRVTKVQKKNDHKERMISK